MLGVEIPMLQHFDNRRRIGESLGAILMLLLGWTMRRRRRGQQGSPEDTDIGSEASETESEEVQCGELMALDVEDLFALAPEQMGLEEGPRLMVD